MGGKIVICVLTISLSRVVVVVLVLAITIHSPGVGKVLWVILINVIKL